MWPSMVPDFAEQPRRAHSMASSNPQPQETPNRIVVYHSLRDASTPRFPLEIWILIFSYLTSNKLAQLLTVSKSWRDVISSTPKLWTWVHICHEHQFIDESGLTRFLGKSGRCLLDLVINVPEGVCRISALTQLTPHVNRLRVLDIDVWTTQISVAFFLCNGLKITSNGVDGNPAPHLED